MGYLSFGVWLELTCFVWSKIKFQNHKTITAQRTMEYDLNRGGLLIYWIKYYFGP